MSTLSREVQEPTRLKIARLLSAKDELTIVPNLAGRRLVEQAYLAVAEIGESNLDTGRWGKRRPEVEAKAANDFATTPLTLDASKGCTRGSSSSGTTSRSEAVSGLVHGGVAATHGPR